MWTNLPDMPEECAVITCVRVKNQILISGYNFRLMSYNIDNEAYSYIGFMNNEEANRAIVSFKEKLYLFEDSYGPNT